MDFFEVLLDSKIRIHTSFEYSSAIQTNWQMFRKNQTILESEKKKFETIQSLKYHQKTIEKILLTLISVFRTSICMTHFKLPTLYLHIYTGSEGIWILACVFNISSSTGVGKHASLEEIEIQKLMKWSKKSWNNSKEFISLCQQYLKLE